MWKSMLLALAFAGPCEVAADHPPPSRPLTVIHYRADGHLMLAPVAIGGRNEWFVFDSGAPHLVLDPRLTARLRLEPTSRGATTGTGAGAVGVGHLRPVSIRIGALALRADDPWEIDLSKVPIPGDVRGLIGADLWKNHVVRVDPVRGTLSVFDPARFRPVKGEAVVPLIIEGEKMFVEARLDVKPGLSVIHKLRVDTGAEETVNDPIAGQALVTKRTTVGNGLGENFVAVSGLMDAVHLGPFTIRRVWGPGGPGPAIGMEIFRRFVTTFDAPHGRLYLSPTPALKEPVPAPTG